MGNKKKRSHTAQAAATHSTSANHLHSSETQYGNIDKLDWSDNFPEPPLDSKQYSEAIRAHLNEFDDIAAKQANGHAMERTSTDSALSSSMSRLRMQPPPGSSSKSKKKNNKSTEDSKDRIWNTTTNEERERIKEFWLNLGEEERKSLIKVEKEAVLKKMKEQQKHSCSCSVCGRKRTAIEEELEVLYDAYYEELEQYANQQQFPSQSSLTSSRPNHRPRHSKITEVLGSEDSEGSYEDDEDLESDLLTDEDELSEDDYSDDDYEERAPTEFFKFGNSLTVKGGILTVADDLLRNDGKKFIEMMEQLAERRMQREEEAAMEAREYDEEEDDDFDDDDIDSEDYDDDDDDQDVLTEEQRMAEGRRMFQIFAARMFEQRVLTAYREKVAQERQARLLQELELEDSREKERELKKQKEKEKKKDKKRQQQQKKEEERLKKEAEKAAEEAALKAEEERKAEELRKRKEEQRLKKEAEKKLADAEKQRKEEEKRKRMSEERAREQKRLEQVAKEKKAKEEAARKEREAKEQAAKEAKEAKDIKAKKDVAKVKEADPLPRQVAPTTILTRKVSPPTKSSNLQSSPAVPRGPSIPASRVESVTLNSNGHGPSFQGPPRNGQSNPSTTPAFQASQNNFPRAALGHPPSMPVPLPPPGIGSHSSTLHDPFGFSNAQQKHFPPSNVMTRPNGTNVPALHGPPGVFATTPSMHVPAHIRSHVSPPSRSSQPQAPQHNPAPFNAFPGVIRNGHPQREELIGEDIFARRSVSQVETPPVSIGAIGTIGRPAAPRTNSQQLPAPIQRPMNGAPQRSRFGFDSKNDVVGSRALLDDDDPVIPAPAPLIHSNDTWSSSPKPTWQNSNPSLEDMKDRWGSIGPKKVDAFTNGNTPSSTTWGF